MVHHHRFHDLPWRWGVTDEEVAAPYPCDGLLTVPSRPLFRGVDVDAPSQVVFRWLCQVRVAPYSYDWIDNRGRRSPTELTPGADELAIGQRFQVFEITAFEHGAHITGRGTPAAERIFGPIAVTYRVAPCGTERSRLVVRLDVADRALGYPLAWGDLVMMRRQLLNLKNLAERGRQRTYH